MTEISLSPCQEQALLRLTEGTGNVFVTGAAGTGKSFVIRQFLQTQDRKAFPILATTGTAAVLVGGRTLHSFFGLGIGEGGVEATVERALSDRRVVKRLRDAVGLVLDEVSMLSGEWLFAAECIARRARDIRAPWGGLRILASGDFAQLPPVTRSGAKRVWAFQDRVWEASEFEVCLLQTMMRTKDEDYMAMLGQVRRGQVTEQVQTYLNRRLNPEAAQDELSLATVVFAHRAPAESYNAQRLAGLRTSQVDIPTVYTGTEHAISALKKNAPIPEVLQIKKGAHVMIRVNDPAYRFVNGSLGTLESIEKDQLVVTLTRGRSVTLEKHSFSWLDAEGKVLATALNFPIQLAYATTIHKSQGATLDAMICDLRRLWEPGQAYVALSRLRSGAGLSLLAWDKSSIRSDPAVSAFYAPYEAQSFPAGLS